MMIMRMGMMMIDDNDDDDSWSASKPDRLHHHFHLFPISGCQNDDGGGVFVSCVLAPLPHLFHHC